MIITDLFLRRGRTGTKEKTCFRQRRYYWCCGNTAGCDTGVVMRIHWTYKKW